LVAGAVDLVEDAYLVLLFLWLFLFDDFLAFFDLLGEIEVIFLQE
jgi:hypothetical protein